MYVSDWTPPKTPEEGETHIQGGGDDDGFARPLMALVAIVFIAISTMFAYDYIGQRLACTAHAVVEQC